MISVAVECGLDPYRKEVITMLYAKPELVLLADARVAIHSTGDAGDQGAKEMPNTESTRPNATSGAYEADE
jgi:hypothetical protein